MRFRDREESLARIRQQADEVVCLRTPDAFFAVGQFFTNCPR